MGVGRLTRWSVGVSLAGVLLYAAPEAGLTSPALRYVEGRSVPAGWYVFHHRPPVRVGEVILIDHPPHYRKRELAKIVAGVAGDRYCYDAASGGHRLNERLMPGPSPEAVALGIPVWRGCRVLAAGEVVGYGQSADSYDSRYFGPVRESELWGAYVRLGG